MDYAMPHADDLPLIASGLRPVPATTNALGVKGVGEAGTTAALAAVMNAVADALPEAPDIDMPATPERLWRALHLPSARLTPDRIPGESRDPSGQAPSG
jgi:carbon-monoxide dehydrogenase large subunit